MFAATVSLGLGCATFGRCCLVWAVSANTTILVSATRAILVVSTGLTARATRVGTATVATATRLLVIARLPAFWALGLGNATLGAFGNV